MAATSSTRHFGVESCTLVDEIRPAAVLQIVNELSALFHPMCTGQWDRHWAHRVRVMPTAVRQPSPAVDRFSALRARRLCVPH
jgi:hypothetical protein